jgi:hypothetical protein
VAAPECMVVGCESSAYVVEDITANRGEWARLPGDVLPCNFHRDELAKGAEWMLDRDERKLYVGDRLRNARRPA